MKLYDYVFNIINGNTQYHKFNETDKSNFNKFMINRVLSMDYSLVPLAQENNSILNILPDDIFNDSLQKYIPAKKYELKYKKSFGKKYKNKNLIIEKISDFYEVPMRDAEMYFDWLSEEQINLILKEYGI